MRQGARGVHLEKESCHCHLTRLVTGVAIPIGESSTIISDGCSGPAHRHLMGDVSNACTNDGGSNCPVQWHEEVSRACSSFPELCNVLPGSML